MAEEIYWVVEARLPIQITEASSVDEAARKAARIIERDYNVDISNWFLRVFEYGGNQNVHGPVKEYFSSPGGTKFRLIDGNIDTHKQMIEKEKENGV